MPGCNLGICVGSFVSGPRRHQYILLLDLLQGNKIQYRINNARKISEKHAYYRNDGIRSELVRSY